MGGRRGNFSSSKIGTDTLWNVNTDSETFKGKEKEFSKDSKDKTTYKQFTVFRCGNYYFTTHIENKPITTPLKSRIPNSIGISLDVHGHHNNTITVYDSKGNEKYSIHNPQKGFEAQKGMHAHGPRISGRKTIPLTKEMKMIYHNAMRIYNTNNVKTKAKEWRNNNGQK